MDLRPKKQQEIYVSSGRIEENMGLHMTSEFGCHFHRELYNIINLYFLSFGLLTLPFIFSSGLSFFTFLWSSPKKSGMSSNQHSTRAQLTTNI